MSESTKEQPTEKGAKKLALPAFQELADIVVEQAHKGWLEDDCPGLLFRYIARDIKLAEMLRTQYAMKARLAAVTAQRDAAQGELERLKAAMAGAR